MGKYRAIPQGYMTVGEVAKKMGVTVRTLQYYDREKLLCPSAESEGGRRLYSDKDFIRLYQILSLKSLGFSLEDIRNRLTLLDTPEEVAEALTEQADGLRSKIAALSESLREIEQLKAEVLQMQSVDFKKYADIIVNLQMKNEYYYLIKHFDDKTLDFVRGRFDMESSLDFQDRFKRLNEEILCLQKKGVPPDSEEGRRLAKEYWQMIMEFVNGDMSMLPKLMEIVNFSGSENDGEMIDVRRNGEQGEKGWKTQQSVGEQESESGQKLRSGQGQESGRDHGLAIAAGYIGLALESYFEEAGINPFEEEQTK